jgi:tetratricopeptide (TPR) repeat protein
VEAQTLYERALASARRASRPVPLRQVSPLWKRLGTVRQLLGDYAGANEAYTEVRRLHRDDPLELARMAERHAEIAERQGRARAIAHWASRGLRALDVLDSPAADAQRAHLLIRLAGVRYQRGHPRDARRWAQRAVEAAERSGSKEARAAAYGMLDATYVALGRPERATNSHRALELYRQLRQPDNMARLQNNLGAFAYYEGRWSDALRLYEDARANFEKVGNLVDAALGRSNIAEIFADQGRLDEAERLLLDVLDTWRSMSFPIGTARATRYLARVHLRRGDATTALALFDEARAIFDDQGIGATVHEVDVWRAECLLRIGELHEAGRLLGAALAREISTGSSDMRAMVHRLRAAAAAAAGRPEDAWAEIDESLHHARSRGATFDVALALETRAVLTRLGGRPQDEGARRERERLLAGLGVVAPPPPLPASVAGD